MRDVEARIAYYRTHPTPRAGLCAAAVMRALAAPWQGLPDAAAVALAVPEFGMHRLDAPRGSIVYWSGGARARGHVCLALGNHAELSVDVNPRRPGVAQEVPFDWFAHHWPGLDYIGWSWWWGRLDTRPAVLVPPRSTP